MLVLTRKSNESIMIGDEIELTILSVSGDKVRVGIQAPREIVEGGGSGGRIRTTDQGLMSPLLYH